MRIASCAVASAVLFGFGPALGHALTPNCAKDCTVVITMSAGCGSGIKVAPDPIVVPSGASPTITWQVQSDAWQFDENGIFIQQAGDAFEKTQAAGKTFKFKNSNNKGKAQAYKYDVNLKGAEGKCKLDPTIVNQ